SLTGTLAANATCVRAVRERFVILDAVRYADQTTLEAQLGFNPLRSRPQWTWGFFAYGSSLARRASGARFPEPLLSSGATAADAQTLYSNLMPSRVQLYGTTTTYRLRRGHDLEARIQLGVDVDRIGDRILPTAGVVLGLRPRRWLAIDAEARTAVSGVDAVGERTSRLGASVVLTY
ncbi:MAG: hypothetical protein ACE5G2_11735, partial [Candidatus Krumholzibacteriia bacterium]